MVAGVRDAGPRGYLIAVVRVGGTSHTAKPSSIAHSHCIGQGEYAHIAYMLTSTYRHSIMHAATIPLLIKDIQHMNTESAKGKANRNTDGTERGPFAVQTWNALDEASNKQWRDVATYKTMGGSAQPRYLYPESLA